MSMGSDFAKEMTVLVVDDNPQVISLTKHMLLEMGCSQVFTAKDGHEALDFISMFGENDIDVVLCDWNMPRVTGFEVLKQVRTVDPDMPFLMVTGVADYDSVMQCKALGITGYIKKPFSKDDLRRKMQTVAHIIAHRKKAH